MHACTHTTTPFAFTFESLLSMKFGQTPLDQLGANFEYRVVGTGFGVFEGLFIKMFGGSTHGLGMLC